MNPLKQHDVVAAAVAKALIDLNFTLATAESCTGGWLAKVLTDIAGSSVWFERGFVTYSNAAKIEMLGVNPETLDSVGAVSEDVAMEMAVGAVKQSHADVAVSVSGIAGPGGGTPEKPVGTVWFAWASKESLSVAERYQLQGDRESIRRQSVLIALQGILSKFCE